MKHLFILGLVAVNSINHLFSQDATLIYTNTVNSTVTIETDIGLGSGFFVAPNIIATNYHVMEGALIANCYLNNSDTKFKIDGYLGVDKSVDLILLKVSTLNKPAIKFSTTTVSIGQKVYVIGSPKGLPATISDGIISGMRDIDGCKLIQMTAPISLGSSGGPVLNSNGELIGISVSQLKDGQNINFAIPKSNLDMLLNFKKEVPEELFTLVDSIVKKNDFPIDVVDTLVNSCLATSGGNQKMCSCLLGKIQMEYTYEEFALIEVKMQFDQTPADFMDFIGKAIADCRK